MRAAVVLIVFVVAAIALVGIGTRAPVSGDAVTSTTTPSTTSPSKTSPTTTTTTVPHSSVSVVVANATATPTNNLAGHYTTVLAAQGWAMHPALDASTTEATSTVYFQTGQQAPAELIASALGLKPAAVQPFSAAVPVAGASAIDVVVVIGADLVAQAST